MTTVTWMARPSRSADGRASHTLTLRLTPEELALLDLVAARRDETRSETLRRLLRIAARRIGR